MEPGSTPRPLVQKKTWRDSLRIDMLISAVTVLVVAQSISEIPEGLMNNPVFRTTTNHSQAHNNSKQDKQFTYKLAMRRVPATNVEVEKQ